MHARETRRRERVASLRRARVQDTTKSSNNNLSHLPPELFPFSPQPTAPSLPLSLCAAGIPVDGMPARHADGNPFYPNAPTAAQAAAGGAGGQGQPQLFYPPFPGGETKLATHRVHFT